MFQPHEDILQLNAVQANMLGLVVGIMQSYHLTPHHVGLHYNECSMNVSPTTLENPIDTQKEEQMDLLSNVITELSSSNESSHQLEIKKEETSTKTHKKRFVNNRRAFRDCLSEGLVICPRYDKCLDDTCSKFHVRKSDICPHAGRNNVCNNNACEKIVIKACRKGKNCSDKSCSYRH